MISGIASIVNTAWDIVKTAVYWGLYRDQDIARERKYLNSTVYVDQVVLDDKFRGLINRLDAAENLRIYRRFAAPYMQAANRAAHENTIAMLLGLGPLNILDPMPPYNDIHDRKEHRIVVRDDGWYAAQSRFILPPLSAGYTADQATAVVAGIGGIVGLVLGGPVGAVAGAGAGAVAGRVVPWETASRPNVLEFMRLGEHGRVFMEKHRDIFTEMDFTAAQIASIPFMRKALEEWATSTREYGGQVIWKQMEWTNWKSSKRPEELSLVLASNKEFDTQGGLRGSGLVVPASVGTPLHPVNGDPIGGEIDSPSPEPDPDPFVAEKLYVEPKARAKF